MDYLFDTVDENNTLRWYLHKIDSNIKIRRIQMNKTE